MIYIMFKTRPRGDSTTSQLHNLLLQDMLHNNSTCSSSSSRSSSNNISSFREYVTMLSEFSDEYLIGKDVATIGRGSSWHILFLDGATAPSGPGPPHYRPSHSDTPHSAGLLWTSDHPDAETST
jgi:hypothetical protein